MLSYDIFFSGSDNQGLTEGKVIELLRFTVFLAFFVLFFLFISLRLGWCHCRSTWILYLVHLSFFIGPEEPSEHTVGYESSLREARVRTTDWEKEYPL